MNRLREINERLTVIDGELRALHDAAGEERSLTEDEQTSWDALASERDALVAERTQLEARMDRIRALADNPGNTEHGDDRSGRREGARSNPFDTSDLRMNTPRSEVRDRALRAIEACEELPDEARAEAERKVRRFDTRTGALARHILATGSPAYRSAFGKMIGGEAWDLDSDERQAVAEARAMSLTDASGGFAVPFTLDPTIIDSRDGTVNPFRRIASVRTIVTDTWNGVSSAGVTASWDAEAAEVSDDSPTLTQPSIPVHKAQAFVPFSVEIQGDWAGLEEEMRREFANAKDDLEATAHAVGTGVGQPTGIVTALDNTASEIAPTTAETFAVADIYKVEEALPPRFRSRAQWAANRAIYNDVRQFDTQGGASLWERIGAGLPAQLIGYPVNEASAMDDGFNPAVTADNFLLILGDWQYFRIVDRVGMSIELIPHLMGANRRPTGQRGMWAWWRTGSDSVLDKAFRMLNVATTL